MHPVMQILAPTSDIFLVAPNALSNLEPFSLALVLLCHRNFFKLWNQFVIRPIRSIYLHLVFLLCALPAVTMSTHMYELGMP